jgi:sugar lactone lactonase YvrE
MKLKLVVLAVGGVILSHAVLENPLRPDDVRSPVHQQYAQQLWARVQALDYRNWREADEPIQFEFTAAENENASFYVNTVAEGHSASLMPPRSVVVREHFANQEDELQSVTVYVRGQPGFDSSRDDWYCVHYLPDGRVIGTSADKSRYGRPGFAVYEQEGRLWVFRVTSPELAEFLDKGELAKHAIRPGAGPSGMTLKGPDSETLSRYMFAKSGFVTRETEEGHLWLVRDDAEELDQFLETGRLEKHATRVGGGPLGMTLKAPDTQTISDYLFGKAGFVTRESDDGRLWVVRSDADELDEFSEKGRLEKHVTRVGAGPAGITLKAPDRETIDDYLYGVPGFVAELVDGRLWIFAEGSQALEAYRQEGTPEKHTTRPAAGPLGMTVKGPDSETIDAYLRAVSR